MRTLNTPGPLQATGRLIYRRRLLFLMVIGVVVLGLLAPQIAMAQEDSSLVGRIAQGFADALQGVVASLVFLLMWLLALVAGVVVAIEAWFLHIVLYINFGLVNSAPVKIGFPIVLSIANLAFVAGMVVIAIATILRQERYGMKKILWKLVVMAILVNFGLVICGVMLKVSDDVTLFFIDSVNPAGTGPSQGDFGALPGTTGGFANALAGAFTPPGALISVNSVVKNPALASRDLSTMARVGNAVGQIIIPLVSVLATLGSFLIIIITLGTLAVMLLYRYVKVGMLLITLPLAWASFVFPAYQEHYKKWWTSFTKWVIFPPVVIFFIWVGLKVSEVMSMQGSEFQPAFQSANTVPVISQVSNFLGGTFAPVIAHFLKILILFGIMMGGLVAGQELGIKVADSGIKAVNGASNWAKHKAGNIVGTRARTIGKRTDKKTGETTTAWQRLGAGMQRTIGLRDIPGWQAAGQWVSEQGYTKKRYDEEIEKERKKMEALSNQALLDRKAWDPLVEAAKVAEMAKRGLLDNSKKVKDKSGRTVGALDYLAGGGSVAQHEDALQRLVKIAEKTGNDQALYNVRPDLVRLSEKVQSGAVDIVKAVKDVMKKIPASEADKISTRSLDPAFVGNDVAKAVFLNLSNGHLARIAVGDSLELQQKVIESTSHFSAPGSVRTGEEKNNFDRIKKHLTDNPNWSYPP